MSAASLRTARLSVALPSLRSRIDRAARGDIDSALAGIGDMGPVQRRAARQQCRNILDNPGSYADGLVALGFALR
jgi:hypothetical protein